MKTPSRPDVVTAAVPPGVKPTGWQVSGRGEYAQDMLRRFPARIAAPCPDLGAASIDEVLMRISVAGRAAMPLTPKQVRGATGLLRWLASLSGDTWQQRWITSGAEEREADWITEPALWLGAHTRRVGASALKAGFLVLVAAEVLSPSLMFFSSRKRDPDLTDIMTARRDPGGFAAIEAATDSDLWGSQPGRLARWQIAAILAAKGGGITDITVGDCVQLRQVEISLCLTGSRRYLFYAILRSAGVFTGGAPATLRRITSYGGQLTPEQLIDRYHVENGRIRDLLVDYLTERQPALDYTSLEGLARYLGSNFWRDLEIHHPGIESLKLSPEVASAWKERLRTKTTRRQLPDGTVTETVAPRGNYIPILHQVRAFYLDLAQWATEDPARWAPWAVPSPISATEVLLKKTFARRKARIDQRTRDLRPFLPTIVDAAAQRAQDARVRLEAALATDDDTFTVCGETFTRAVLSSRRGTRRQRTAAVDASGRKRHLLREENRAFWGWAAVEFLRHTGVRIEEMLETSHHSITQYQLPKTGEIIPLLHIAPSKTDQERLLVVSPELADVLATIITRVRGDSESIPLVPFYDEHERVWEPPSPLLFQWNDVGHRSALSTATIRTAIKEAFEATDVKDADGQPLYFRPHDFRRIFTTDAILNGMPPHIAQLLLGHKDINTTMGYKTIYPPGSNQRPPRVHRTAPSAAPRRGIPHPDRRRMGRIPRAFRTSQARPWGLRPRLRDQLSTRAQLHPLPSASGRSGAAVPPGDHPRQSQRPGR